MVTYRQLERMSAEEALLAAQFDIVGVETSV